MTREQDLYAPVKALFERAGYIVKGEVGAADLVACRDGDDPVVVELKLGLSLKLYHQAVARLSATPQVYLAVPRPRGPRARRVLAENRTLCRRLGLGLLTVRPDGKVDVICEPGPYAPRRNARAGTALKSAFDRLRGDPNDGGATRHGLVTGYRQDALVCAAHLAETGPARGRDVVKATGVAMATRIMRDNHYGWFSRVETGVYALTEAGQAGLVHWAGSWEDA
ncbi:DUF2161 domain-containing phosphodiesterase [Litorisediminicola beolgyonensis]|uniref:DUF2161 domain-containing phosphodiesterase n=1 Tax=Litorisediminicola beolgyonensis TaxID=1173614 RepID=A0ABW3ZF63_9RHOB